jgi:hypothetical protein
VAENAGAIEIRLKMTANDRNMRNLLPDNSGLVTRELQRWHESCQN